MTEVENTGKEATKMFPARQHTTFKQAVDNNSPERIRSCDLQKLVNSLTLRKACRIDGIPNECLRQRPTFKETFGTLNPSD
jgi:hypothetical protein